MSKKITSLLLVGGSLGLGAVAPCVHAEAAVKAPEKFDEVVVTARRREENAQTVPISATVLNAQALDDHSVQSLADVQTLSPGLRIGFEGTATNVVISMRGLSRAPVGEGAAAVVPYFAEVPMAAEGSIIPTYDLANIQVLKGPQGTLFGRNTIGGAVLISPEAPSYQQNGYVRGGFGTYNDHLFEGAINTPIIDDKVALRVAAQSRRRDGYTINEGNGGDLNDINADAFRVSLLLDPIEHLSNTTILDWTKMDENGPANIMAAADPNFLGGFYAAQAAQQKQWGPYKVSTVAKPYSEAKLFGLTNKTTYDMDAVTLKNIFGYRYVQADARTNTDGSSMAIPLANVTFLTGQRELERHYFSDEFQALGNAFNNKVNWITGLFYSKDEPDGISGTNLALLGQGAYVSSYRTIENKAVFGQIGWDLSDWVDGLTLNMGLRYNKDDTEACAITALTEYATEGQCHNQAALNAIDGAGNVKFDGHATTWTVGLDYKINDNLFTYITSRRGYREGGVNTPLFESPTTKSVLGAYQTYDPEYVTDIEIGLKSEWSIDEWRGRFNVAAFNSSYKDAQNTINTIAAIQSGAVSPIDAPQDFTIRFNSGELTIQGIDLEATVSPFSDLTFSLSGNYVNQVIDKRAAVDPVLSPVPPTITSPTPQLSYTFAVNYVLPVHPLDGDLVFNADYYWSDERDIGTYKADQYDVADFRIDWRKIAGKGLDVGLYLRNAFDKEYVSNGAITAAGLPVTTVFYGEPRTYGLEATYHFGSK